MALICIQAGPRICLGKDFAYGQKIFSGVLLGSCRFKLSDERKEVNYRTMLNLQIDGGSPSAACRHISDTQIEYF